MLRRKNFHYRCDLSAGLVLIVQEVEVHSESLWIINGAQLLCILPVPASNTAEVRRANGLGLPQSNY